MGKIKILNINASWASGPNIDGISTVIMNLYRNMDRKQIQYDMVNFYKRKSIFEDEFIALGGHILDISKSRGNKFNVIFYRINELKKVIKEREYNIVCFHNSMPYDSCYMWFLKRYFPKVVFITHSHNSGMFPGRLYNVKRMVNTVSRQLNSKFADLYFACSEISARFTLSKSKMSKVYIINNAIDLDKFSFNEMYRKDYRRKLGIEKEYVIGNIGRLAYPKNQEFLIFLFSEYLKINENSILLLVGDGENREKLLHYIEELNLKGKVIIYGHTTEVEKFLCVMDVFVFPSVFEGFGIAAIEAQVSGLPIICSNSIPKQIAISNNIDFLSLSAPIKDWMCVLGKYKNNLRSTNNVKNLSSFDIKLISKEVENIFNKCILNVKE